MAQIDERAFLPSVTPTTSVPDAGIHLNVRPAAFGGETAAALQQFGGTALQAGQHWGQIAADDMATQFETNARKVLYGDPGKTITKADGTTAPDNGYFGLEGRLALDARKPTEDQLDKLIKDTRGKLTSFDQQKAFDSVTRRYRNILSGKIGEYADRQGKVYATGVNTATIKEQVEQIATNPNDDDMFKHHTENMVDSAIKNAQLHGAQPGDAMWNSAQNAARAAAAETRIRAIGATDPMRGMRMADEYKGMLGSHYDNVVDHLRARAEQQKGRQVADGVLTGAGPPVGDDAKAVVRHYEPFHPRPIVDTDGKLRVGYSSDTVTKPNGTTVAVTPQTVVTQEDADRDLDRRLKVSQGILRQKIGGDTWDGLSPQAKASLTSIIYNYGDAGVPQTVIDAAKTGEPAKIAQAIRGLARHNNGINAGRRASEANNVAPGGGPVPSSQADQIAEVLAKNLPPTAESAAIARINHAHANQNKAEVQAKSAFDTRVKDVTAEALNTGNVTNPIPMSDFVKIHGPEKGPELYEAYQSDVQYGVDFKSMQEMPDAGITQLVNSRGPQPGEAAYDRKLRNQERLTKAAEHVQKQRAEDPAGSVNSTPAVKEAFQNYNPQKPETFAPVISARIAAQERLEVPTVLQTAITEAEAKQYAAALKPIAKEGTPPQNQEEVINGVVEGVKTKYGAYASEAMSRILYHVTLKKDASEVLANALVRNSKGEAFGPTPDEAKKIQIERDAERAAQIATQVVPSITSGAVGGGPAAAISDSRMLPEPKASLSPQAVGQVVNQANQKTLKPFNEAVDTLRSDPAKYMPYFVKKFGVMKVPPDLQQYIPKPAAGGNGG